MPKRKATKTTDLETQLTKLIDRVAPGNVTLCRSRLTFEGKHWYELTLDTRESKMSWHAATLAEVVNDAEGEPGPEEDPIRPAWRRLTRFQREVVSRTLQELGSKHMARAAAAKVASDRSAYAEYELADAFHAAVEELDFFEVDENDNPLPKENLEAEPIHVATPRRATTRPVE